MKAIIYNKFHRPSISCQIDHSYTPFAYSHWQLESFSRQVEVYKKKTTEKLVIELKISKNSVIQ